MSVRIGPDQSRSIPASLAGDRRVAGGRERL